MNWVVVQFEATICDCSFLAPASLLERMRKKCRTNSGKVQVLLSPLGERTLLIRGSVLKPILPCHDSFGNFIADLRLMNTASLKKTRRRGLRRITSALAKAALAAIIGLSSVKAEPSRPANPDAATESASSVRATNSSPDRQVGDPVYGMSSTRGARYLLRNGLDYLDYGEFQRALKFLRETESRKNELNDGEILVLKKSIERAQRGLREAADVASPYALSDQARNRSGFNPSRPEARTASQYSTPKMPERRKSAPNQLNPPKPNVSDSDEGESIQLARSDFTPGPVNSQNKVTPQLGSVGDDRAEDEQDTGQPRQFPNHPQQPRQFPNVSELIAKQSSPHGPANVTSDGHIHNENSMQIAVNTVGLQQPPVVAMVSNDSTALAHSETEATGSTNILKHASDDLGASSPSVVTLSPIEKTRQLPVSGSVHGMETGMIGEKNQTLPSSTHATNAELASPMGTDELPPLPANLTESAIPDHPTTKSAPIRNYASEPITAVAAINGDLPPLPNNPDRGMAQSADQSTLASAPTAQDLTMETRSPADDPSIATPHAAKNTSARSVSGEDEESLLLLAGQDNDLYAVPRSSLKAVRPIAGSITPLQTLVGQPELPFDGEASGGSIIDSQSVGSNLNCAREVALSVENDSHAPSTIPNLPPAIEAIGARLSPNDSIIPYRPSAPSTLHPGLKREVERIARKQEDELRRRQQAQPTGTARDTIISDLRAQTQLDISRAPSPAEARPIKAIPVPEDWVPLSPRTWSAQRKYWAAAATCHLPLYFQDPVLERYGHSVEQFVGPIGRYLTYPLDDPTQSSQRNQILQPFFSAGLFALQIGTLPYNVLIDPPWEAQYDLGYYRPGDVIPTDLYWLPLHGYGPPLRGSNY